MTDPTPSPEPSWSAQPGGARPVNFLALASVILGALATASALTVVGLVLAPVPAILALVLGVLGHRRSPDLGGAGRVAALVGIALEFAPALISLVALGIGLASGALTIG